MDPTLRLSLLILGCAFVFVMIVALIKGIVLSKHKFICSECNKEFYPKWYQVMFETHFGEYFKIKCPHCGKKAFYRSID